MTYPLPPATYDEALARRAATSGPVAMTGGSGYFAPRGTDLDPALFEDGDHLRYEVRRHILETLYDFWRGVYHDPQRWSDVWIAGSGITPAWNASRESGGAPGDLDTLIGVHYDTFYRLNPAYQGNSETAMASHFNQQLHDGLWPRTALTTFGRSTYELTYYVNPGGSDIRAINPYAAYNVSTDTWTVRPVDVPADFSDTYFDNNARQQVLFDQQHAVDILHDFSTAQVQVQGRKRSDPGWVNWAHVLHDTVRRGADLFSQIHDGRHVAFEPGGGGFFDPANYRWQAGKGNGTVSAMRALKQLDEQAHKDIATPCGNTDHLLLVAALANGR